MVGRYLCSKAVTRFAIAFGDALRAIAVTVCTTMAQPTLAFFFGYSFHCTSL